MKFTTDTLKSDDRECVAYLTHMELEPSKRCLVIKATDVEGQAFWLYHDGDVQVGDWLDYDPDITKKFYKGDSVTITF